MLCLLPLTWRCRCSRPPPLVAEPSMHTGWRGATRSGKTSRLTCLLPFCCSKLSSTEQVRCRRPPVVDLLSPWRSLRGSERSRSLWGARERLLKRRELHESSLRLRRPRRSSSSSSSSRRPTSGRTRSAPGSSASPRRAPSTTTCRAAASTTAPASRPTPSQSWTRRRSTSTRPTRRCILEAQRTASRRGHCTD